MALRCEAPGSTVEYVLIGGLTGSTYGITLKKVVTGGPDTTAIARTTSGVTEDPAGSGIFTATVTLPNVPGDYYPLWDKGGTPSRDNDTTRVTYSIPAPSTPGAPYFTTDEFRAKYPNDTDVQGLSDDEINLARTIAENIIEKACHVAFVVRTSTITVSGQRTTRIELPLYLLRSVQSVTIDGVTQDVSDYRVGSGGVYRSTVWPRNVSNIEITVTHGYDAPTAWLKDAAMTLTYHRAIKGPISDRATSAPAGDAGGVITLLTPGTNNAVTGIPDVDEAIIQHALPDPSSVSSVLMADASNTYPDPLEDFAIG